MNDKEKITKFIRPETDIDFTMPEFDLAEVVSGLFYEFTLTKDNTIKITYPPQALTNLLKTLEERISALENKIT